jgi:archaemetzincin
MRSILGTVAFFLALLMSLAMDFRPPTAAERLKAIGSTDGLPETLRRALEPGADFEPIRAAKPGDWLAEHRETGQSFEDFVKSKPNRPDKIRTKIYLQPLGQFPKGQIPLVETLRAYAAANFAMPVEVLPTLSLTEFRITTRINRSTQNRQILTGDVLTILKRNIPADAFCVLAITMEDLYPDPSWNFVFGQASLRERVGVYSFARYDPAFYGQKRGKDYEKLLLWRSCKVLAHETGHMFGLTHCIYFQCALNGSNHLEESDARPMHLCPVCLRKLQYSTGFDVVSRYNKLFHFYSKAASPMGWTGSNPPTAGFDDEAQWVANRLEWILGAEAARAITQQNTATE